MAKSSKQRNFRSSLMWRFIGVGMIVYIALFIIMLYAVPKYTGVLWTSSWADVPAELVGQVQAGERFLILSIFGIALPFWMIGTVFISYQVTSRLRELTSTTGIVEPTIPIVTEIVPATNFYLAEEYHQKYIHKRRGLPY